MLGAGQDDAGERFRLRHVYAPRRGGIHLEEKRAGELYRSQHVRQNVLAQRD